MTAELGERGRAWLHSAPSIAQDLAARWGVSLEGPMPNASCALVVAGRQGDAEVVLRIPQPEMNNRGSHESLVAFASNGGVPVLELDPQTEAILMPRLVPGTTLADAECSDEDAARIASRLIARLHRAPVGEAVTLETRFSELRRALERSASPLLASAWDVAERLLATQPSPVRLHGDLHHFNILLHGVDWLAIDPEHVTGDPAYEPCAFMRNPLPSLSELPDLPRVLSRRIEVFEMELGFPAHRIWGWAFAQTVLCAVWDSGESSGVWRRVAEELWLLQPDFWN